MRALRVWLGLRTRVTLAFALGALLISATLGLLTFGLTRENLIRQRESNATSQVYLNARLVRDALRSADPDVPRLLASLETSSGSRPLLFLQGRWFAESFDRGKDALPATLREDVVSGTPAIMRFDTDGQFNLGIGVPVPAADAAYFEVFALTELRQTLDFLRFSLIGASVFTTAAGAFLGAWASRRVLRPLSNVAEAAERIAAGELDTRVEAGTDPDLMALAGSFNEMAAAMQRRIERDARFASDVSHELRSPLTTLSASIEVLAARHDQLDERGASALDLLSADVRRFSTMIEDLLEISRFDAGQASLHLEPIRIGELVLHTVSVATDHEIEIDTDAELADMVVPVDKRRLVRVLANLIENADTHGGGARRVTVARDGDRHVKITVEDSGAGVPDDEKQLIFERFARGRTANNRGLMEGSGLGLALVEEHVVLHRGEVWVEDAPGGGARFCVRLPGVRRHDPPTDADDPGGDIDEGLAEDLADAADSEPEEVR